MWSQLVTVTSQAIPSKDLLAATSVAARTSDRSVNTINSRINLAGTLKSELRYTVIHTLAHHESLKIYRLYMDAPWSHS